MPVIKNATGQLTDINQLLVGVTALIPVVGGLVSAVVAIFASRNEQVPKEFLQAAAEFQAEIDKLRANDQAWRDAHPNPGA